MPPANEYTKPIAVLYSASGSNPQSRLLEICVLTEVDSTGRYGMRIQLTRENDAQFLYVLRFNETDYLNVRSEQSLLCDFADFPQMLNSLLDHAQVNEHNREPKYGIHVSEMRDRSLKLEVVEPTKFKSLVHLALTFRVADDGQLRDHLIKRLNSLKKKLLSEMQRSQESEKSSKKCISDVKQAVIKLTDELKEQKESSAAELDRVKAECDAKRIDMDEMIADHDSLTDKFQEKETECEHLLYENEQLGEDVDRLRCQLDKERENVDQLSRQLNSLRVKEESLEEEIDAMRDRLDDKSRLCEEGQTEIRRLTQVQEHFERQLRNQEAETEKGVDIIGKILRQHKKSKACLAEDDSQTQKVTKVISLEKEIGNIKLKMATTNNQNELLKAENVALKEQNAKMTAEVERLDVIVKTKDSLLDSLHKRLEFSSSPQMLAAAIGVSQQRPSNYQPVLGLRPTPLVSPPSFSHHLQQTINDKVKPPVQLNS